MLWREKLRPIPPGSPFFLFCLPVLSFSAHTLAEPAANQHGESTRARRPRLRLSEPSTGEVGGGLRCRAERRTDGSDRADGGERRLEPLNVKSSPTAFCVPPSRRETRPCAKKWPG